MLEIISQGGWVMYLITACSVIALGFIIERLLMFHYAKCDLLQFYPGLETLIRANKMQESISYCERFRGIIPQLLLVGLRNKDENIEEVRQILVDDIQIHILPSLYKNLNVLTTIAKTAPMLGLLGTIIGMYSMFQNIAKEGLTNMNQSLISQNISYALITTVGGLVVAIPILLIYAYFQSKIRSFELDIFHCLTKFLRAMRKRNSSSTTL